MPTTRRQFVGLASTAGALFPFLKFGTAGAQASLPTHSAPKVGSFGSAPQSLFDGESLSGWGTKSRARWVIENGELVGHATSNNGGWLFYERGFQDFVLKFKFRTNSGDAGVLLRNAPVDWSRFFHPQKHSDHTAGIYVALTGEHAGAMSLVTLDASGKEVDRKIFPVVAEQPMDDKVFPGNCGPIPCAGINNAQGATSGYPADPPVLITKLDDGWQQVEVMMRGSVLPSDKSDLEVSLDAMSQYGTLGFNISGAQEGSTHFKDVVLYDLTQRAAGLAKNSGDSGFLQLTDLFYSEGVAVGDLNRDGHDEVVAGPFYYAGPDYKVAREIYPPTTINPGATGEHGNYSNCFLAYVHDFTGDGWPDILMIMGFGPMPSFAAQLFINPRGESRHWDNYNVVPRIFSETTQLMDIDGDGIPELILSQDDQIGYAKPGADPTKPWEFHAVSEKAERAPHGIGVGDVNGDGRLDIIAASGWWEQPARKTNGLWKFHPELFGATEGDSFLRGGADIFVYDVNGDGVPDIITSLNAHGPGLAWFEQQRDAQGNSSWKRHLIMGNPSTPLAGRKDWETTDKSVAFTELHALALADMDGDGGLEIVTGKRWWSHGYVYDENNIDDPPVVYRFKLIRKPGGVVEWVPRLIHNASGLGTQIVAKDLNKDGKIEVVTSTRKGTFILYATR